MGSTRSRKEAINSTISGEVGDRKFKDMSESFQTEAHVQTSYTCNFVNTDLSCLVFHNMLNIVFLSLIIIKYSQFLQ